MKPPLAPFALCLTLLGGAGAARAEACPEEVAVRAYAKAYEAALNAVVLGFHTRMSRTFAGTGERDGSEELSEEVTLGRDGERSFVTTRIRHARAGEPGPAVDQTEHTVRAGNFATSVTRVAGEGAPDSVSVFSRSQAGAFAVADTMGLGVGGDVLTGAVAGANRDGFVASLARGDDAWRFRRLEQDGSARIEARLMRPNGVLTLRFSEAPVRLVGLEDRQPYSFVLGTEASFTATGFGYAEEPASGFARLMPTRFHGTLTVVGEAGASLRAAYSCDVSVATPLADANANQRSGFDRRIPDGTPAVFEIGSTEFGSRLDYVWKDAGLQAVGSMNPSP